MLVFLITARWVDAEEHAGAAVGRKSQALNLKLSPTLRSPSLHTDNYTTIQPNLQPVGI